jgi:cytochrome b561
MNTTTRLGKTTIILHWLVAITIIGLCALGFYMTHFDEVWDMYGFHKSIGVLALVVILARVVWRIRKGWPEAVGRPSLFQHRLAKAVHWALLLASVGMPLSGALYSGASGHGVGVFGLSLVPRNPNPTDLGEVMPFNATLSTLGQNSHEVLAYLLLLALVVHVAGALKHHLFDRDTTLLRMLGKDRR